MSEPRISVVVPSHDRPLRLRWLLNALEEQTLDRDQWEVIVGHDSSGEETGELIRSHPLAADGTLREVRLPPGTAPPGANRNAAWREARAPLIAFTDDDCRPPTDWLERTLEMATAYPGRIVQGRTEMDPDEGALTHAPYRHSQLITPPSGYAEACNIVYPREVLERANGFDEEVFTGEDSDLMMRCREFGVDLVGDGRMLTYHAVVPMTLFGYLRSLWRWRDLPRLIKRHPDMRQRFPMWIFWKPGHLWLPVALLGAFLSRRSAFYLLLAVPWWAHDMPEHGGGARGHLRSLSETPTALLITSAEFAVLAYGSVRNRTVFL